MVNDSEFRTRAERDQALDRLRTLEEEVRTLLTAMKDQIFVLDREGHFVGSMAIEPAREGESIPGAVRTLEHVFPTDQIDTIRNYVKLALETGETVQVEYRVDSGGNSRWFSGSVTPMSGDRVLWEARDTTERKKAEEALRHYTSSLEIATVQQEKLHKALEQNAAELERRVAERTAELERANQDLQREIVEREHIEGMLRKRETVLAQAGRMAHLGAWDIEFVNADDTDAGPLVWSDEVYHIFGYEPGHANVSNDLFFKHVHLHDREKVRDAIAQAIATGEPYSIEHRIVRADGTERVVHEYGDVSFDEQHRPVRIVGAVQDVTDRKRAEHEREQLHRDLELRAADLEASNKELEAFTYSLSHDLRAPINLIDQFARMALEDYAPSLPEDGRRLIQLVHENAEALNCLAEDLLTLTRIARQPLRRRPVSMQELVNQVLTELEPMMEGRAVRFEVSELPPCVGDATLLKQVWLNLLSNALKFTRRTPGPIIEVASRCTTTGNVEQVETASNGQPPSATARAAETVYYVRDNGAGFDMANADRLFRAFQRLHHPEEFEGNGLGLAIVERVIRRHGGRVWAEAHVSRGASFSFTIG